MQVRQSDLSSWARCPRQKKLRDDARAAGRSEEVLSATIYGTVMHAGMQVMQELTAAGASDAVERAVATFEYYWDPEHVRELDEAATSITWLPRQSYGGLLVRGRSTLRAAGEVLAADGGQLLATELPFTLPITLAFPGGEQEHTVHGTIDRLVLRSANRRLFLSVEDFKTGVKPRYLRYALQWTIYSWATMQPGFWAPFGEDIEAITAPLAKRGYALYADDSGLPIIPRRGRWLALRDGFEVNDCGWRTEVDYERMKLAMTDYIRSVQADIYPLTVSGDTCMTCHFARDGSCGGIPIAAVTEGEPDAGMDARMRL